MNDYVSGFVKKNLKLVILVVIGVVLMFVPSLNSKDSGNGSIEKCLKTTLEMAEGVGEVDVMVTFGNDNKAEGAIIVAEGASDARIKKMLHDSAVSVLNIPEYKVQVLTKKK